jgi:hypothetical protein
MAPTDASSRPWVSPRARLGSRAWLWPNLLSLDAPLVAVLWQMLFARCFHAGVNALASVLLVLAVWLIYAADRVLDGWKDLDRLPRHQFYRRHWRAIAPIWGAAFALAGWLAWTRLSQVLLERGLAVLAAVGLYFIAVHFAPRAFKKAWPKEAAVAILFAVGASLAAWNQVRSLSDAATIVLFSCLCWINCIAIQRWEHGQPGGWAVSIAALAVAAIALFLVQPHRPILSGAECASALAFVLLDRERPRFSADALRVLADAALLTPILFLPIAGFVA